MNTKIVYVLVSTDKDIYLEQAWVSAFSLKHCNTGVRISVVCDRETGRRITEGRNEGFRQMVDEILPVDFDKATENKERSRWLKTNLRNLVQGSFLFIDTDTVITGDLSAIDGCKDDVAIVLDLHCHFMAHPFHDGISRRIKRLFGVELKPDTDYYNSGIIFSKDTETAHRFFDRWHQLWASAKDKKGGVQDQQSLAVAIDELGVVAPLPGEYNCQVLGSVEFLHTARIVHFFNTQWSDGIMSPFFDKQFYAKLKQEECISPELSEMILNCRSTFVSPSMMVGLMDMRLWRTPSFKLLRKIYRNHRLLFRLTNKISDKILKCVP